MAISVITDIPIFVLSSQLREVKFSTDLDKIVVAVYDGETKLYSTTIYPFDGVASVFDLRTVIELYMRKKDRSYTAFTVYFSDIYDNDTGSFNLNTIYCSLSLPIEAGIFASYSFLTTLSSKRTCPHSTELLSFLHGQEDETLRAYCTFVDDNNTTSSVCIDIERIITSDIDVKTFVIKYDDIVSLLVDNGYSVDKLNAYSIVLGNRSFTYYVVDAIPDVSFTFKNCFNLPETVLLNAVTTTKSKVQRSIAMAKSKYSFYDQTTEKTYEVQSSPLTEQESQWIEQLAMSLDVRKGVADDFSALPSVLITESTIEMADSNTELNRIKFTWRYEDPQAHNNSIAIPEDRIHTEQFTHQYN